MTERAKEIATITLGGKSYRRGDDPIADYIISIAEGDITSKTLTPKKALASALNSVEYNFPKEGIAAAKETITSWMGQPSRYRANGTQNNF